MKITRRLIPGCIISTQMDKMLVIGPSMFTATCPTVGDLFPKAVPNEAEMNHYQLKLIIFLGSRIITSIGHDSESKIQAEDCDNPGCYQRAINYNVSVIQMAALADLSKECHQFFRVGHTNYIILYLDQ